MWVSSLFASTRSLVIVSPVDTFNSSTSPVGRANPVQSGLTDFTGTALASYSFRHTSLPVVRS
jgi:hypothetical protein